MVTVHQVDIRSRKSRQVELNPFSTLKKSIDNLRKKKKIVPTCRLDFGSNCWSITDMNRLSVGHLVKKLSVTSDAWKVAASWIVWFILDKIKVAKRIAIGFLLFLRWLGSTFLVLNFLVLVVVLFVRWLQKFSEPFPLFFRQLSFVAGTEQFLQLKLGYLKWKENQIMTKLGSASFILLWLVESGPVLFDCLVLYQSDLQHPKAQ